jgi:Fe-S cluster biosynthesis and repair protein YggX
MPEVHCSRCGATRAGLERPPLPGPAGAQVASSVCAACWQEWKGMQVKLINEYRLSPLDPQHFDWLLSQMRTYLNLDETGRPA